MKTTVELLDGQVVLYEDVMPMVCEGNNPDELVISFNDKDMCCTHVDMPLNLVKRVVFEP